MNGRNDIWPGLDLRGFSLTEIRRQIRGEGGGVVYPPSQKRPERLGAVLERIGFGKQRGQNDERAK